MRELDELAYRQRTTAISKGGYHIFMLPTVRYLAMEPLL